nr:hypothetical protein [Brevundimonas subvibrioides]
MTDPSPSLSASEPMALTFKQRVAIVNLLDKQNRLERSFYLYLTVVSAAALVGLAIYWTVTEELSVTNFLLLMTPTGVISVTQARVLQLWYASRDILLGIAKPHARAAE